MCLRKCKQKFLYPTTESYNSKIFPKILVHFKNGQKFQIKKSKETELSERQNVAAIAALHVISWTGNVKQGVK